MSKKYKVFVYGTLRPSNVVTHKLYDYDMYNYNNKFPYIKFNNMPCSVVYGNVIEVGKKELMLMDKYEGTDSGLYTRKEVEVLNLQDGAVENVLVYIAGPALVDSIVPSGDWFDRN